MSWERTWEQIPPAEAVRCLIAYAGYDPTEEQFADTPRRVLALYAELRERRESEVYLTLFESKYDDLMVVRGIPMFSLCAHHLLPFFGEAHVGYVPNGKKILGLSKAARIVQQRSAGLCVQEELARQIASDVSEGTGTENVAVILKAVHTCMLVRGPKAYGADTVTSAMLGAFRNSDRLRSEFLSMVGGAQ